MPESKAGSNEPATTSGSGSAGSERS
jgi:hypothetical protein